MASSVAGPSTYYFASRHQQKQSVDHTGLDDAGASPPSSILQRLRRIEARAAALSPKEKHSGRHVSGNTELVWEDKTLVWSQGGQLVRTFTFQHDIVQACWASMGQRSKRSRRQRRDHANGQDYGIESSFSAAQRQMRASWAGGDENTPSSSSHLGPRQLVVILSDAFWVYSPSSGHEYTTAKNFKLAQAWPATSGVFLQRSLEAEDHIDATPQLPTLFYLGNHLDEVTPVAVSSTSGSTLAFTEDVKESIVFVCDQGDSRILVTVRPGAGEIRLYAYAIARHGAHAPQSQPQPHPQRPPFQRQQSTSAANMSRNESAPNNTTSQIGKGRPSMPRRSSRLSSHNTSTVGAPSLKSAPPMTRRRSSRYPSSAGDLGNMSRIDETFNHSAAVGGHAGPSSASMAAAAAVNASSAAAITNFEQQEDAVEAEEMGQMVEGLARRKTLPERGVGADESLARRPSMGSSRHRRASNLGRSVPYTPRNLNPRLSTGRGRLSRDGIELDFDPMSMSAAAGGTLGGATLAEEDFSQHLMEEKEGGSKRDHGAMEHAATAVLQLLDVVRVEPWSDGADGSVKVFAHEDGNLLQVYLHAQGRLFHRTLRRLDTGQLEVVAQSSVDARGAAVVEVEGGKRHVILLSGRGTLHLCLEASPSGLLLDLALERNRDAWLLAPSCGEHGPAAASLSSEDGARLDLKLESGADISAALDFAYSPRNATIRRLLTALETCTTVGAHLRRAWILASISGVSEWEALLQALCGPTQHRHELDDGLLVQMDTFGLFAKSQPPKKPRTTGVDPALRSEAARILNVLNAVAQDCRLDSTPSDLTHLARIIVQVGAACGARRLVTYWSMLVPAASRVEASPDASLDDQPADAFQLLAQSCQQPNAHLAALGMDERQVAASMPTFARLLRVVQAYNNSTREEERYLAVATAIVRERIPVDSLPWCLWLPLRLVLTHCAQQPLAGVPAQVCRLIERYDLIRPRKETQMRYHSDALRVLPSGPRQLHPLSAMLFSKDYRLHDVVEMLETHRIVYVQAPASTTKTDEELREIGISLLHNVGERIKASAIGRGMLFFLTRAFRPTLRWDTPPLNRRVLLRPPQPYHHPEPRLDSPEFEWPEFHNGAASALEMVVTGKAKVDSIWYFSQGAGERNARHAGLLLGLGLAGHFATIGQVHTYRYLGDRHGLTSIGLLLGLSATFAGRGDPDVRSLLACHVKAFLPEHSANLAHSTLVQAAALLGTGLLFLGADVSHIAEALCDQIGAQEIETTDPTMLSRAAYSLSAAFGAGLVMLGRGRRCAMTMRDKKLCRKLERCMVGASRDSFAEETASDLVWRVDERITSSTAAVAYALFFLKSNQADAARSIPMPKDFIELDAMRPDIVLIHSVARNLIMWDDMAATTQWLESTLPAFLRTRTASPIAMQVKTNIIAGACLALSFKYAGSADPQAKQLLLSVYRDFEEQASRTSKQTYDGRVLYSTLRSSSDIIALALAVVLAGTGDLDLLKILRPAHARVPCSEPYGSHMAIHMAMGLLFLGGGRLTLGTSDASVAAMLIAFYPRFPTRATDNRSHLQAYRHLWVLAVEPRLVVTQDVASGEMACVPIEVRARNGAEMAATTPFQLPHLDHIVSISLESDRYEKTTLDSAHCRFQLKRKEGHLDYSRDPQGHRTAMAREMGRERAAVGPESSAMLAPESKGEQAMLSPNLRLLLAHARGDERLVSSLRQCVDRNAPSLLALGVALEQLPRSRCPQTIRDWMWAPRFIALLGLEPEPQLEAALESLREAARQELARPEVREALLSGAAAKDERLAFVLAALAPTHAVEDLVRLRELMGSAAEERRREGNAVDDESAIEALIDVGRAATRGEVDGELIKVIASLAV